MNRVHSRLIAITGGSGAGKSWLADRLQQLLPGRVGRLRLDAFYRDRSHLSPQRRAGINYDDPRSLDWPLAISALQGLKEGRGVVVPVYDFATHSRARRTQVVHPTAVVLVEGLWVLRHRPARQLFDLSIFLDCPRPRRLAWRTARDTIERGRTARSVRLQFQETVAPMHERHVEPQRKHADLILRQPLNAAEVDQLFDRLFTVLAADVIYPASKRLVLREQARSLLAGG